MQKFRDMCICTLRDNIHKAKLANCVGLGIQDGYADGYLTGTYQVFNPKTENIILIQDMTFLQNPYGEYSKVEKPDLVIEL